MIPRFAAGARIINDDEDHLQYLTRLDKALAPTDWKLLAHAIMGTHTHWFSLAGFSPFDAVARPLHCGFARWINRKYSRLGPVLAERPSTYIIRPDSAARVISYIHTNPVRAGIVSEAEAFPWSSHRAYLGMEEPIAALKVPHGLGYAGFTSDAAGRAAFGDYVKNHSGDPLEEMFTRRFDAEQQSRLRRSLGSAVELGTPVVDMLLGEVRYPIVGDDGIRLNPSWDGPLQALMARVVELTGVSAELLGSKRRGGDITAARRLVAVGATRYLGRTCVDAAQALGITKQSCGELVSSAREACHKLAKRIAEEVVAGNPSRLRTVR